MGSFTALVLMTLVSPVLSGGEWMCLHFRLPVKTKAQWGVSVPLNRNGNGGLCYHCAFDLNFPEDFHIADLQGKPARTEATPDRRRLYGPALSDRLTSEHKRAQQFY